MQAKLTPDNDVDELELWGYQHALASGKHWLMDQTG